MQYSALAVITQNLAERLYNTQREIREAIMEADEFGAYFSKVNVTGQAAYEKAQAQALRELLADVEAFREALGGTR